MNKKVIFHFYIVLVGFLVVSACKSRTTTKRSESFLASANRGSICEDLSSFVISDSTDYDAEIMREMRGIRFREDFSNISDIFNKAKRMKSDRPAAKDLSVAEVAAVLGYTNAGYQYINQSLWDRKCDDFKMTSRAFASGINRSVGVRGHVFRGGSVTQSDLDENVYRIGDTVVAPAFSSSSMVREVAERFSRNAFFEIDTGVAGYLAPISSWSEEDEVTFVPGTKFRVEGFEVTTKPSSTEPFYKVKLSLHSTPVQKTIVERHPKGIDAAMVSATGLSAVPTLIALLRKRFPQGQVAGHSEYNPSEPCSLNVSYQGDDVLLKTDFQLTPDLTVSLRSNGEVEFGGIKYVYDSLKTQIKYRTPEFPKVIYQLSNTVPGTAQSIFLIALGYKNDQLKMDQVQITPPVFVMSPACILD